MAEATEKSGFFDSVDGDRLYSAADFNKLLASMYADGVRYAYNWDIGSNDQLKVSVVSGLTVKVKPGKALYSGKWYELSGEKQITLDAADANYPRIDAIYVHFDAVERRAHIDVKKGTPSSNPDWDYDTGLLLATARIEAGATAISELVDLRDSTLCGFATMLDAPDTVQEWEYIAPSSKTSATSFTVSEIETQIRAKSGDLNAMFEFNPTDIFFVTVNGLDVPKMPDGAQWPDTGRWLYAQNGIRIGTDAAPNKGDVVRIRMIRRKTIGNV